jgi:DNA repair protein RecO
MALVSTTAFILKLDPLSEKDLVVALLTQDHGVVRAAVRGARGKSKRAAALQLLTEVAVTYFRREGADLARVDGLEIVRSAFDLAARPGTAMLLPYLAESALTFVPESELGGEVYRLVRHVLDALEAGVPAPLAARYFEVWLLRFAGVLDEGDAPEPARALLASVRKLPLAAVARRPPPAAALEALEDLTREARRSFLGHELRSYRFLRALG